MEDKTVLVTGAGGYIAAHVVSALQRGGARVRGTVLSLATEETEPLRHLVPDAKHPLELLEARLEEDDGWDEAVAGCWAVVHMASPFPDIFTKTQAPGSLVGSAVWGARRVLGAAARAGVDRVVMTSSLAAVTGGFKSLDGVSKHTEEDWTDPTQSDVREYNKSKALAEKEAWKIVKNLPADQKFSLAVINPAVVLGPPLLRANAASATVGIITKIITGESPVFPDVSLPVCDVRDVAAAHVKALTEEEAHGHRHIIVSDDEPQMTEVADIVHDELAPFGYNTPTARLPYWLAYLASFFSVIAEEVTYVWGKKYYISNKRMKEVLGVQPTPYRDTITDMLHAVIDMEIVPKTEKYKTMKK